MNRFDGASRHGSPVFTDEDLSYRLTESASQMAHPEILTTSSHASLNPDILVLSGW
jgi:hypothetical protein